MVDLLTSLNINNEIISFQSFNVSDFLIFSKQIVELILDNFELLHDLLLVALFLWKLLSVELFLKDLAVGTYISLHYIINLFDLVDSLHVCLV